MAQTQIKSSFLIDIRQTPEYGNFMKKLGWQVENTSEVACPQATTPTRWIKKTNPNYIFIKKLPLLPLSLAKILKPNNLINFKTLKEIIKKNKILFLKIHPFTLEEKTNTKYQSANWRINTKYSYNSSPLIPTKTIWLDLTKTEIEWLKDMKPKTRYNIKKTQNLKLKSQNYNLKLKTQIVTGNKISSDQLCEFYNLWAKNKPFNWLFRPSFNELKYLVESFGDKCFFVFVNPPNIVPSLSNTCPDSSLVIPAKAEIYTNNYLNRFRIKSGMTKKSLLASCLVLTSSNMSFYWHNCSSQQGKQLFAPSLCIWEALKESKKRGLQVFDLEGIYDERFYKSFKSWQGFTRFKSGFGGKEIYFPVPFTVKY